MGNCQSACVQKQGEIVPEEIYEPVEIQQITIYENEEEKMMI